MVKARRFIAPLHCDTIHQKHLSYFPVNRHPVGTEFSRKALLQWSFINYENLEKMTDLSEVEGHVKEFLYLHDAHPVGSLVDVFGLL